MTEVARTADLHYRLLGAVEARVGGRAVPLPRQLGALLAVLLLHANQSVTASYLIDQVWGNVRPADPRRALHVNVSRLRRAFGAGGDMIHTTPDGYRITLVEDQLDLAAFRMLVVAARDARDPERRAALLDQALALWDGEPFSDLAPEARVREHASALLDERLRAVEELCGTRLDLGQHHALLPQLTALTAQHPLRQQLWEHLMIALWRSDRPADALAAYAELSRHAREAGASPGDAVRRLHRQILTGASPRDEPGSTDGRRSERHQPGAMARRRSEGGPVGPSSDANAASAPGWGRAVGGHRWIRAEATAVGDLHTGHAQLIGRADAVADAVTLVGRSPGPTVTVFSGPSGVGKTALAVQVAHRMRARFPDGQWLVELHGDGRSPRSPDEVLDHLLNLCGAAPTLLSGDLDAKSAELRSRLAGQQVLLVLDDASDTRQVMPLLPGTAGSAVIVTSRRPLPGLVVHFGAVSRQMAVVGDGRQTP
ncbi:AfsR/SARP family transcriptional regulator [Nocardioides speluncae]|uniref:AfsR/SARP family transcriptional regulator n=1 Tax=Nocardioides speluncae TaxID=2670337 RepID=UPI00137B20AF|nr:BTAD domain-containing putative transcriptional regulator [Nocardioides speluncae]